MHDHLSLDINARAIVMTPLRGEFTAVNIVNFKEAMARGDSPLECLDQGEVTGQDDWADVATRETQPVKYWWGIFGRRIVSNGLAGVEK